MGSEQSQPSGDARIDPKPVDTTDFWSLFNADLPTGGGLLRAVSLFQGEPVVKGQLWTAQSPLERAAKNLMIYRHPSILKFLNTYVRGSHKILLTERCRPLSMIVATLSDVEICLGLRTILCGLVFLVEQGGARHLNVSLSSIYITPSGGWRLAGFEHIWKSKEVNAKLLEISQQFRSKSSLDPDEIQSGGINIEQYAFAMLFEDLLKSRAADASMPHLSDFRQYCSSDLRNKLPHKRPRLSDILQHPYFNHEFVIIHSFLTELPLKSPSEKLDFFTTLIDRLRQFDEQNVATQLSELLLSRMVFLDPTAQLHVIPYLLSARSDANTQSLFSADGFSEFMVPRILQLFCVHDAQTRLILLEYFSCYIKFIPENIQKEVLLPELLLGIKDTNDILVAATLRSLAELVPILGASVVIGRNRSHVFADGRPQAARETPPLTGDLSWMEQRSITPVLINVSQQISSSTAHLDHVDISESFASTNRSNVMMERLSPDGGEDEKTASDVPDLENDAWSDWEADPDNMSLHLADDTNGIVVSNDVISEEYASATDIPILLPSIISPAEKNPEPVEIDYFADMEPVIQKTSTLHISNGGGEISASSAVEHVVIGAAAFKPSRLQIQTPAAGPGDDEPGWDDDVDGWDDG